MPRKKLIPRKKKPPFKEAFSAAKAVLASKIGRRKEVLAELQDLNRDIPNLERTCRALEAQLNWKGSTGAVSPPTSQTDNNSVGGVVPISDVEIPPEIRAQLPPEDMSKFGSHYGTEETASEDLLPPIEGKELIPEKK